MNPKKRPLIAIVTPTFNRSNTLKNLFSSLLKQSSLNFEWWLIDDGSNDNTFEWFGSIKNNLFDSHYVYQTNGGKHRAINSIIKSIKNELTFIVDSDDTLISDAILSIEQDWLTYESRGISGLSYLRGFNSTQIIGNPFLNDYEITTHEKSRIIDKVLGDKAEIWKTELLKLNPFLEFEGEKFFSEQYVYLSISGENKILTRNKIIYITEYLPNGLTDRQRCLQFKNPNGTLENSIITAKKSYGKQRRIKSFLMIVAFSIRTKSKIGFQLKRAEYDIRLLPFVPLGMIVLLTFTLKYYLKCTK